MWDEIVLNIPAREDIYALVKRLQTKVEEVTTDDTAEAEREWRSATKQNALANFSALPTVDLRPAVAGADVLVRFVTKAHDRFEMRRKLYEAVMEMMEGAGSPVPTLGAGDKPATVG
jgi:hypothetical protein